MPRLDGDVFFFGTAMALSPYKNPSASRAGTIKNVREAGLIEEGSHQG
jgi:hypothetical protein